MHNCDSPENEALISTAARRGAKSTPHSVSVFRGWIQSGSQLSIDLWVEERTQKVLAPTLEEQKSSTLTEEEWQIKQEEMEMDPFADEDEMGLPGAGIADDPIDLTLD